MTEFLMNSLNRFLEWFQWSLTEWILTLVFILVFCLQLYFYLKYFRGIARHSKKVLSGKMVLAENQLPVTVIITARDQKDRLEKQLPLILEQDYPVFQVVVVNDASSDDTDDLLKSLSLKYPHLYHTFLPPGVQNISTRKMALTVGIKAAIYDYLLFTDANCEPSGNQWISSIMRQFSPGTSVVLSYSRYDTFKGLFKNIIAYDNLFQAIRFLGLAASGKPYMGIGKNMAYRKELFFNQRGFAPHLNLNTGEDDLFISDVAKGSNTRIEASAEAVMNIVSSDPKSEWKETKINHIYTSSFYKTSAKFRTGLELVTRYAFYGLFGSLLVLSLICLNIPLLIVVGALFVFRFAIQVSVLNSCAKVLNERKWFFFIVTFDIFLPCYSLLLRFDKLFRGRKSYSRQVLH
jgi:glycosyltransferase involved in cell wall biosynthesis